MRLKRIGFSRNITLEWLDDTARYTAEMGNHEKVRAALNYTITSYEGQEAKRKTIDVLIRTWTRVPEEHIKLRDQAIALLKETRPEEKIWLHWGLLLLAYPIFYDVTATMGRLLALQGQVTRGQIKRSIVKDWGERTTLNRTISRIVQSLKDWNIFRNSENNTYQLVKKRKTKNVNIQIWLLEALLNADPSQTITLQEISRIPSLFPFTITLSTTPIITSKRFEIINQASNIQLVKLINQTSRR